MYCSRSCKDMAYQKTAKGRIAKKRADDRWYKSEKGREYRAEYASSIDRIQSSRESRKRNYYSGNGIKRLDMDGWKCVLCGYDKLPEALQISHVVPRCKGGDNSIENIRTTCANCHAFITSWLSIFIGHTEIDYDWRVLYEEAEDEIRLRLGIQASYAIGEEAQPA